MNNELTISPINKDSFQELLIFTKKILDICEKLKIEPIVYGSSAYFYHTHDENMPVNNLDLLVPESMFPDIMRELQENNISYEKMTWPSIVATQDNSKVELDSVDRYLGSRSRETSMIQIENLKLSVINMEALTDIYKEAVEHIPKTPEYASKRTSYEQK